MATGTSTYSSVLVLARSLILDIAAAELTDAKSETLIRASERKIHRRLSLKGGKLSRGIADMTMTAVTSTNLTRTSTPALPVDFVVPLVLWEKVTAETDDTYTMMDAVAVLTPGTQGDRIGEWAWIEGALMTSGATVARTIRMQYERTLANFAIANVADDLAIEGSHDAMAFLIAGYFAVSRGSLEQYKAMQAEAEDCIAHLVNANIKMVQAETGRRPAYGDMPARSRS